MAIQFLKGSSAKYHAEGFTPVSDVFYLLDDGDFYLGSTKLSNGADVAAAVASIAKNAEDIVAINAKLTKLENTEDTEGSIRNIIKSYLDNALENYYTKAEVEALVARVDGGKFIKVDTLPTSDIDEKAIYLVPKDPIQESNVYDEYIYTEGAWEKIGDTEMDLTGYVQKDDVEDALSDTSVNPVQNKVVKAELDKKTTEVITTAKGRSLVWNENSGGGAKFENVDGTYSFVGVNDSGRDGITGQLYSVDKNNGNVGTRLNMTNNGFFYTNGASSPTYSAENELATKKDISDAALTWGEF